MPSVAKSSLNVCHGHHFVNAVSDPCENKRFVLFPFCPVACDLGTICKPANICTIAYMHDKQQRCWCSGHCSSALKAWCESETKHQYRSLLKWHASSAAMCRQCPKQGHIEKKNMALSKHNSIVCYT